MKIALAQLNYHTGNFAANTQKIIETINSVINKADLVVFSELAICGYPPRDFLEFEDFLLECESSLEQIASVCKGISAIVGAPSRNNAPKGKNLYNSAYLLVNGKVEKVVSKTLLPTYDIFDENRYFEPNTQFECIEIAGKKVALTICEDLWNVDDSPLYVINPMDELVKHHPDLMINIAASPYSNVQQAQRSNILRANCHRYNLPLVYVNHVGAQTELIFDGDSQYINAHGETCTRLTSFKEQVEIIDTENSNSVEDKPLHDELANVHKALVLGIRDYFNKLGLKKAILGLSGGIDSAVVVALAAEALGAENVLAVLMPSQYTANESVVEAINLAKNLGCQHKIISIQELQQAFLQTLNPLFEGKPEDVTEENLQARTRGVLLMGLSNKHGFILLNTTNKSEMAVGYGTLYGDLCGGLSVIGDVYKTDVFRLARYINRDREIIPEFIITRPPSAELKADQQDTDSLPPYHILDPLLKGYVEDRKGPKELIAEGFDEALVKRILRMVNMNEWKRHQTAPILRVSKKAFGMGRRMPIVAKYLG
ncbi:MAG: NAD+ synthase [Bacteroidetes bacterium]|nr:NAD+ synthase [Bacteroidota bacterium]